MRQYNTKKCGGCPQQPYTPDIRPEIPFVQGEPVSFGRPRTQPDGSIVYPKKGWEPPPPIEGYERDPGNKWRFVPKWPECEFRQKIMLRKPCGAVDVKMVCKCVDCPLLHTDVKLQQCADCEYKKPAAQ